MRVNAMRFEADNDPQSLLAHETASIVLDVGNIAGRLEDLYEYSLNPVLEGLYKEGESYPITYELTQELNTASKYKPRVLTFEDELHRRLQLLQLKDEGNKGVVLYTKPTVMARGLRLVELLARYEISLMSQYYTDYSAVTAMSNMFKNDYVFTTSNGETIECEDAIRKSCENISEKINAFIGTDTFHIYRVKLYKNTLTVLKFIDWRIYDWHVQRHERLNVHADQ